MEEENLFNASEIIDGLIEIYTSEYHGGVTEKGLIDFAKKIITISKYEKDTVLFGKTCRTCKHLEMDECYECATLDVQDWNSENPKICYKYPLWEPKYTKEDFF